MCNDACIINRREEGSALVISLVILALLTVIGIAVTNTTSIELQIAGNDKTYKENFYLAEGAAMMIARILENVASQADIEKLKQNKFPSPVSQGSYVAMPVKGTANDIDTDDIQRDTYWEGVDDQSCTAPLLSSTNPPRFIPRKKGLALGSSLGLTGGSRLYDYAIFARRKNDNSSVVIELGYKKRY